MKVNKKKKLCFSTRAIAGRGSQTSEPEKLSEIKNKSNVYQVSEVVHGYSTLVANDYSESAWTIRAFDDEGTLVADKLFGHEIRYVK